MTTILPLAAFFCMGYIFKKIYHYPEDAGQILTRVILNITLPVTIFLSASKASNIAQAWLLPVSAFMIQMTVFGIYYILSRRLKLDTQTECVFITAPLISNTLFFMAPIFYLAYGEQSLTHLILYDIGNAVTIYLIAHSIFKFHGQKRLHIISNIKTIVTSPPVWGMILGLTAGAAGLTIPEFILHPLLIIRETNIFLPMFLLGFYFTPALDRLPLVLSTVFLRAGLGLALGVAFSFLFTSPINKVTVIMMATAPIGLISLIYAAMYDKDVRFASNITSYSMVAGLVICTALDYILRSIGLI